MKRLTLFAAFLLLGSTAHAWVPENASGMGIVMFTVANGAQPTQGVAYSLNQTIPVQKLQTGYLITSAFTDGSADLQLIFVKTNTKYNQGQMLSGWARCLGYSDYEGQNGFPQRVFVFEEVRQP